LNNFRQAPQGDDVRKNLEGRKFQVESDQGLVAKCPMEKDDKIAHLKIFLIVYSA